MRNNEQLQQVMVNVFVAPLKLAEKYAGKKLGVVKVEANGDVHVRDGFFYDIINMRYLSTVAR